VVILEVLYYQKVKRSMPKNSFRVLQ